MGSSVRLVSLIQWLTLKIRVEQEAARGELVGLLLPFVWRINGRYGPHTCRMLEIMI